MGEVKAARPRETQILAPRRAAACILGADARPVLVRAPGGGGYGPAAQRDPAMTERDRALGY